MTKICGFKMQTTYNLHFSHKGIENQFTVWGWAAFKRRRCFKPYHFWTLPTNRLVNFNDSHTKSCMLLFCCAPQSLIFKMRPQRQPVLKIIAYILLNYLLLITQKLSLGALWKPYVQIRIKMQTIHFIEHFDKSHVNCFRSMSSLTYLTYFNKFGTWNVQVRSM